MKILFLYPGELADPKRGTPLRALGMYQSLRSHCDIHLVAKTFPEQVGSATVLPSANLWKRARFLQKLIREIKPDLVYGQTHNALSLLIFGVPKGIKTCADLHSTYVAELQIPTWRKWYMDTVCRILLRSVDGITTVCHPLAEYYKNECGNAHTLHGGVHIDHISSITPERLTSSNIPIITYSGNIRPYQGVEDLLKALTQLTDLPWSFLFVCSGNSQDAHALIDQYELNERTTLLSAVEHDRALALLKGADIAVVPRPSTPVTEFAFASKLPEYLASGTAVVATNVADADKCIEHGVSGWLTPPGDPDMLASTLREVILHPEMRKTCSTAAYAKMQKEFDWQNIMEKTYTFLSSL